MVEVEVEAVVAAQAMAQESEQATRRHFGGIGCTGCVAGCGASLCHPPNDCASRRIVVAAANHADICSVLYCS